MNRLSTRNYVEQGTIGLGTTYQLNMKGHKALGFSLTGGSTYVRSDLNYFKAKAAVSLGSMASAVHRMSASDADGRLIRLH